MPEPLTLKKRMDGFKVNLGELKEENREHKGDKGQTGMEHQP